MKRYFFILLLINEIQAQDKVFEIKTSLDTILLGNYFEVKIIMENVNGQFTEPSFAGLNVISGPNTYSSTSRMNGEVKSSKSYSYFVKPTEVGEYIIEPAKLTTENKVLKTKEKKIYVIENPNNLLQEPNQEDQNPYDVLIKPGTSKPKKKTYKL
ncbi:MAG: BatD family protein [Saprospiraceae bacterium]